MEKVMWDFESLKKARAVGVLAELQGMYRCLSNFHTAPVKMYGVEFPTNEHAFSAAKCAEAGTPEGYEILTKMAKISRPESAKAAGRKVNLRADWEKVGVDGLLGKEFVLLNLVRRKFKAHPKLAHVLLQTGDCLILEGNTWGDRVWGVIDTRAGVEGFNRLGSILMTVRKELGGAGIPEGPWPSQMPRFDGRGLMGA